MPADAPTARTWRGVELRRLLDQRESREDVERYFDRTRGPHAGYTGAWFAELDTSPPSSAHEVTAHDLLAVQTLGVDIPGQAIIALLDGPAGEQLAELLRQIPTDVDLVHADNSLIGAPSPASKAWRLLRDQAGLGRVRTAKLLARKRPRLLPVWDSVVDCALGWKVLSTGRFWAAFHDELADQEHALHNQLAEAAQSWAVPDGTSPLRIFDVVLWMRHHRNHRDGCAGMPA